MDLERARQQEIEGYVHPTTTNTHGRDSRYKTFTEGKKGKRDPYEVASKFSVYGSFGQEEEQKCPVCSQNPTYTCPCAYSDKKCSNGHVWYTNRDGEIRSGNPHR